MTILQLTLQPNCETLQPKLRQATSEYDIPILAAIVGSFGFIFLVLLIILWRWVINRQNSINFDVYFFLLCKIRKCCHSTNNYRDSTSPQHTSQPQTVIINWEANGHHGEKNETIHANGGLNGYNHSKNV